MLLLNYRTLILYMIFLMFLVLLFLLYYFCLFLTQCTSFFQYCLPINAPLSSHRLTLMSSVVITCHRSFCWPVLLLPLIFSSIEEISFTLALLLCASNLQALVSSLQVVLIQQQQSRPATKSLSQVVTK